MYVKVSHGLDKKSEFKFEVGRERKCDTEREELNNNPLTLFLETW
jgi:hypothetical protein